jgi:hypothetical protein
MPSSDRTADFRGFVEKKKLAIPDAKRRKIVKIDQNEAGLAGQSHFGKEYLSEAYNIVSCCLISVPRRLSMSVETVEPYKHLDKNANKHPQALPEC